jgi:hypothetical protein
VWHNGRALHRVQQIPHLLQIREVRAVRVQCCLARYAFRERLDEEPRGAARVDPDANSSVTGFFQSYKHHTCQRGTRCESGMKGWSITHDRQRLELRLLP